MENAPSSLFLSYLSIRVWLGGRRGEGKPKIVEKKLKLKSNKRQQKQEEVKVQGQIQSQTSLRAVVGKYTESLLKNPPPSV